MELCVYVATLGSECIEIKYQNAFYVFYNLTANLFNKKSKTFETAQDEQGDVCFFCWFYLFLTGYKLNLQEMEIIRKISNFFDF